LIGEIADAERGSTAQPCGPDSRSDSAERVKREVLDGRDRRGSVKAAAAESLGYAESPILERRLPAWLNSA
jgi:hypothetical protein